MTDAGIQELINLEKEVVSKKFQLPEKETSRNIRKDVPLSPNAFKMFIRINATFAENFSIGLMYKDKEGNSYLLFRVNGEQLNSHIEHHRSIHYHVLTQSDVESGRKDKPSKRVILESVKDFSNALDFFCQKANIRNYKDYFSGILEPSLFDDD